MCEKPRSERKLTVDYLLFRFGFRRVLVDAPGESGVEPRPFLSLVRFESLGPL